MEQTHFEPHGGCFPNGANGLSHSLGPKAVRVLDADLKSLLALVIRSMLTTGPYGPYRFI
jgi:hypothetical protein